MKIPIKAKKINKRKIIVIAAAAVVLILIILGLVFGIKSCVSKKADGQPGVKQATKETLQVLKQEAEKVENASKTFYTLEEYQKYEYPTGLVITVEVNDYGKLVVLGNKFETDALNDLITYSGVNVGADIGLTDVVYSIRFDKDNVIETTEGNAQDQDTILKTVTETTVEVTKVAPVNDSEYKGYADKILALLKSYVSSHNLTLSNSKVIVNTDDDGNLVLQNYCTGMTQEQADEFASIVSQSVPLGQFVGYGSYSYEISIENNVYTMSKNDAG